MDFSVIFQYSFEVSVDLFNYKNYFFFTVYRRLYSYGSQHCDQCGFPNLVCSCNLRHTVSLDVSNNSRQPMILIDPVDTNERVAGPEGA